MHKSFASMSSLRNLLVLLFYQAAICNTTLRLPLDKPMAPASYPTATSDCEKSGGYYTCILRVPEANIGSPTSDKELAAILSSSIQRSADEANVVATAVEPIEAPGYPSMYLKWIYFKPTNACYARVRSSVFQHMAERECRSHGGHLASIHTPEENNFLFNQAKTFSNRSDWFAWIGLNRQENGRFAWYDGTPLNYTFWRVGQPNTDHEKCGMMHYLGGAWDDIYCNAIMDFFFCKSTDIALCT